MLIMVFGESVLRMKLSSARALFVVLGVLLVFERVPAVAQAACALQTSPRGFTVDLNKLTNNATDYLVEALGGSVKFHINMCRPLVGRSSFGPDTAVGKQSGAHPSFQSYTTIGLYSSASFTWQNNSTLLVHYTGEEGLQTKVIVSCGTPSNPVLLTQPPVSVSTFEFNWPTPIFCDPCNTAYGPRRWSATTDLKRKYNVATPGDCCVYCRTQPPSTGWSWSIRYQTCICQTPTASSAIDWHSDYKSGCFSPVCEANSSGTGSPTASCRSPAQYTGWRWPQAGDVAVMRNLDNPSLCCEYCSSQSGANAWSWTSRYNTCFCNNATGPASDPFMHSEFQSGCFGGACASVIVSTGTTGTTGYPSYMCGQRLEDRRWPQAKDGLRAYGLTVEACCGFCARQGVTGWSWSRQYHTCICSSIMFGDVPTAHSDYISGYSGSFTDPTETDISDVTSGYFYLRVKDQLGDVYQKNDVFNVRVQFADNLTDLSVQINEWDIDSYRVTYSGWDEGSQSDPKEVHIIITVTWNGYPVGNSPYDVTWTSNGADGCFSGAMTARLESGETRRMADLRVGDRVQAASIHPDGSPQMIYSEIFAFGHYAPHLSTTFVRLIVSDGAMLELTPSHHVYIQDPETGNAVKVLATRVRIGDGLFRTQGAATSAVTVVSIENVVLTGAFEPLTLEGTIVVDGTVAGCYSHSHQSPLFAPLRWLFQLGIYRPSHEEANTEEHGVHWWTVAAVRAHLRFPWVSDAAEWLGLSERLPGEIAAPPAYIAAIALGTGNVKAVRSADPANVRTLHRGGSV